MSNPNCQPYVNTSINPPVANEVSPEKKKIGVLAEKLIVVWLRHGESQKSHSRCISGFVVILLAIARQLEPPQRNMKTFLNYDCSRYIFESFLYLLNVIVVGTFAYNNICCVG